MNSNKYEYFLNVMHYCLWLNDMKFGDFIGKIVNILFSPIPKCLFTKEYKKKYYERIAKQQSEMEKFFHNKKNGYHIGLAHHWYGYFYSGYPLFISFLLGGVIIRETGYLSNIMKLVIIAVPVGLCYIPAYRAVFTNKRYLMYFKQFEKEGKMWHKKWNFITLIFCIGSIICTILGICAAFAIVIL